MIAGYYNEAPKITAFPNDGYSGIVAQTGIPLVSPDPPASGYDRLWRRRPLDPGGREPGRQLPAPPFRHLPCSAEHHSLLFGPQSVPRSPLPTEILHPTHRLPLSPAVVGALWNAQFPQSPPLPPVHLIDLSQDPVSFLTAHTPTLPYSGGMLVFLNRSTWSTRSATSSFNSRLSRCRCSIYRRVVSRTVSRVSRSFPASMKSLVQA